MRSKTVPKISQVSAGVDWLTATLQSDACDYQTWLGRCYAALGVAAEGGEIIELRRLQGYEGHGFGSTFVGVSDNRAMAQYSGERANVAYLAVEHEKVHIARLDLQITVQTDIIDLNQGKRCLRAARVHNASLLPHKRRRIDFWLGEAGADTVYIGSASGDVRARIYNKAAQSEDIRYTRCWRYEIVLRNEIATNVYGQLVSRYAKASEFVVSYVIECLRQRGIVVRGLEYVEPVPLVSVVQVPTDVERKLKWLEKQVKPTLDKLSEHGYRKRALEALGLSDYDNQT